MTDHKHESVGVFSRGPCDAPRLSVCACGATQKVGSGTWTVPPNPRSFDTIPPEQRAELLAFSEWLKLPKPKVTFEVYRAEHLPPPSETKLSEALNKWEEATGTLNYLYAAPLSVAPGEIVKAEVAADAARSSLESLYREQTAEIERLEKAAAGTEHWNSQGRYREMAREATERYGFKEGELQMLWRGPGCFERKYDAGEVVAAICDALTREGQTAWSGDGTSCVEQMIHLQWSRAEKAEAEALVELLHEPTGKMLPVNAKTLVEVLSKELSALRSLQLTQAEAKHILNHNLNPGFVDPDAGVVCEVCRDADAKLRRISSKATSEEL